MAEEAEDLERRHLESLRVRVLRLLGEQWQPLPTTRTLDDARRDVENLLTRAKESKSLPTKKPVADSSAGRHQLQSVLGQNARLRRLMLRMHGVAPEMALQQAEANLLLNEQSGSGSPPEGTSRKQEFLLAAGRVMAQNLLLLKWLRSEETLTRALHTELRRLAALFKQMHLASKRDPANGPKELAERLMGSVSASSDSLVLSLEAIFLKNCEVGDSVISDAVLQTLGKAIVLGVRPAGLGTEAGELGGNADATIKPAVANGAQVDGQATMEVDGASVVAEQESAATPPSDSTAAVESASAERCTRLRSLLAQMRRRISTLSEHYARAADIATLKDEKAFVEAEQEKRRRAAEQAMRPLSAEEEFLYVEDLSDTPSRHPVERVGLASAARFEAAVRSSRVAAVVFGAPMGRSRAGVELRPGVEAFHAPSASLFDSQTTAAEAWSICQPAALSICQPADEGTDGEEAGRGGGAGGGDGGPGGDVSALAAAADDLLHRSFDEWTPPTPLLWFELPHDERVSSWETKTLDVKELAAMRRPVGVVFAEGRAVKFLEDLSSVQELCKEASSHVGRLRTKAKDEAAADPVVWVPRAADQVWAPPSEEASAALTAARQLATDLRSPEQPVQQRGIEELERRSKDVVSFELTVPEGAQPGTVLACTMPSGEQESFVVPEGAAPGSQLSYEYSEQFSKLRKDASFAKSGGLKALFAIIASSRALAGKAVGLVLKLMCDCNGSSVPDELKPAYVEALTLPVLRSLVSIAIASGYIDSKYAADGIHVLSHCTEYSASIGDLIMSLDADKIQQLVLRAKATCDENSVLLLYMMASWKHHRQALVNCGIVAALIACKKRERGLRADAVANQPFDEALDVSDASSASSDAGAPSMYQDAARAALRSLCKDPLVGPLVAREVAADNPQQAAREEKADQDERTAIQQQTDAGETVVRRLRSEPIDVEYVDNHTIGPREQHWITVGAPDALTVSGVLYYEIALPSPLPSLEQHGENGGCPQLGFVTREFAVLHAASDEENIMGVGDDEFGWAVDGERQMRWHVNRTAWPQTWQGGDVISLAANIDSGGVAIAQNGVWTTELAFVDEKIKQGVYPAFSSRWRIRHALAPPFKYGPPPESIWAAAGAAAGAPAAGAPAAERAGVAPAASIAAAPPASWRTQLTSWEHALQRAQEAAVGSRRAPASASGEASDVLKGTATWTWRSGAFAAAFAPQSLTDCNLEGEPPLMKPHVFRFLSALKGAIQHQGGVLTGADVSARHRLAATSVQRVARAFELMGPLLEYEDLIGVAADPNHFPSALRALQARIASLPRGETIVFRGGWHNKAHYSTAGVVGSVIHVLERESDNRFALVTCNSGSGWGSVVCGLPYESGIEYHEASSESFPRPTARTALKIKNIPRHRVLDEGFLSILLGQLALMRGENGARIVYDVLLPHLAGTTLDDAMRAAEGEHGPFEEVRAHHRHTAPMNDRLLLAAPFWLPPTDGTLLASFASLDDGRSSTIVRRTICRCSRASSTFSRATSAATRGSSQCSAGRCS